MPIRLTLGQLEPHSDVVHTPAPAKDAEACQKETVLLSLPEELIVEVFRVAALSKRNEGDAFGEC